MLKFLITTMKSLSNPNVAITIVAITPWLVISFLALLYFTFMRNL